MCSCPSIVDPEGRPGMSDVSPLSGISGLSSDSTLLSGLFWDWERISAESSRVSPLWSNTSGDRADLCVFHAEIARHCMEIEILQPLRHNRDAILLPTQRIPSSIRPSLRGNSGSLTFWHYGHTILLLTVQVPCWGHPSVRVVMLKRPLVRPRFPPGFALHN